MTDHSQEPERGPTPPIRRDESSDEVVSLEPLIRFLATYRRVLGLAAAAALVLWGVLLVVLMLRLPVERTGSIGFRLLFDGAADGRYPNGTIFSPAEFIATPVLSEVYRANDLQRFGRYGDFKDSMAILHASLAQELLAASYSARLADSKLTPTDRARLEDEFQKKRDAIKDPVYALTMRRTERLTAMPSALIEKVLNDTLATWAQQAKDLKGATRFDVPIISRDLLKREILERDYLMAADDLRQQARRAAGVAQKMMSLPGAASLRSQKDGVSLSDVSFAIADTLRNKIEPTMYMIREGGLTNDVRAMTQYLHGHVVELRLERDATRTRMQTLQDALQGYMSGKGARTREGPAGAGPSGRLPGLDTQTLIPQISDTFLDRLIEISTQTQVSDVAYRQSVTDRLIQEGMALSELERDTAYYEQLEKTLRGGGGAALASQAPVVKALLRSGFDSLDLSVQKLIILYEELSEQRLNPAVMLYAVSKPFSVSTQYALRWGTAALLLPLALLFALGGALIGCAYHRSAARKVAASRGH